MKCVHCGANIPDDQMICPVCGAEVQIVPDYNPLDDVLAREVRGSVEGHENVSTTLNVYSHLFPSKHSEVAEKLERLYHYE